MRLDDVCLRISFGVRLLCREPRSPAQYHCKIPHNARDEQSTKCRLRTHVTETQAIGQAEMLRTTRSHTTPTPLNRVHRKLAPCSPNQRNGQRCWAWPCRARQYPRRDCFLPQKILPTGAMRGFAPSTVSNPPIKFHVRYENTSLAIPPGDAPLNVIRGQGTCAPGRGFWQHQAALQRWLYERERAKMSNEPRLRSGKGLR